MACVRESDNIPDMINYVEVNDEVPHFEVNDGDGGTFSSEDFIGKRSLLVLFDTTCEDCQRELPKANTVWENLQSDPDCQVIAISRGQKKEIVDKYWKEEHFDMPTYLDPDRTVFDKFANSTIPRFYLINSEGIIQWMGIEKITLEPEDIIERLKNLD